MSNSFNSAKHLSVGEKSYKYFSMPELGVEKLPYSLKILLENMLRTEDGANVTRDHVNALVNWDPTAEPDTEIQFSPARVIMQDFTGVPCIVDLATMREAVVDLGGDLERVGAQQLVEEHGPLGVGDLDLRQAVLHAADHSRLHRAMCDLEHRIKRTVFLNLQRHRTNFFN